MKKCPTCGKEFEDSMRFCQIDGAVLEDAPAADEPAFDPYATIVSPAMQATGPAEQPDAADEPTLVAGRSIPPSPISAPDDVLDLPGSDPLKTVYVSDEEMKAAMASTAPDADVVDLPPATGAPAPGFGDISPPPSPFSAPEPPAPSFIEPEPAPPPVADEPATMIQPPPAAPVEQWTPPPAPEPAWQNQQIGSNTPFNPPVVDVAGPNKTLSLVSMILGILGLTICCGGFIINIAAIITGFMARSKAAADPNQFGGSGMATAGLIMGIVGLLGSVLLWIVYGGLILSSGGLN
jgi:hypothetical protein